MNFKVILATAVVGGLGVVAPAQAAFPGDNGPVLFGAYDMPQTGVFDLTLGGAPVALFETDGDTPNHPSVSPDGTKLLWDRGNYQVMVSDRDGSDAVMLTPVEESDWTPTWAPDGTIVFAHPEAETENAWELWRMNADGTGRERIGSGVSGSHPTVSPDGRWIVYTADREDPELRRIAANGSGEPEHLTEGRDADYTPDGRAVVFGRQLDFEDGALYRYDFASGEVTAITDPESPIFYNEPSVSPDGKRIVAMTYDLRETFRGVPNSGLRTLAIDGTDIELLPRTWTARDPFWAAGSTPPPPPVDEREDPPGLPGPPVAPVAPTAPAVAEQRAASVSPRVCGSRRFFPINVRGKGLRKVTVKVNGKPVKAKRRAGGFRATVDLRTLPKGRFTVSIRKTTAKGTKTETRRYRTCTPRSR